MNGAVLASQKYAAFISYSSRDADFARRLHRRLENYRIPKSIGTFYISGPVRKNRIYPVFRDREELAAGDLGERIESALIASANLIVVCSPHAAASPWVKKEIEFFAGLGREENIFTIIPNDAPLTLPNSEADATASCFPSALGSAAIGGVSKQHLAGDARKGRDGFRTSWLKVVAGLIGRTPGELVDRDKRARRARRSLILASALVVVVAAGFVAAIATTSGARGALAAHAARAIANERQLDAFPFALAALPAASDVLSMSASNADFQLERIGARLPIARVLGMSSRPKFSPDDRFLITFRRGEALLLDLVTSSQTHLGKGYRSSSSVEISPDGAFLLWLSEEREGVLRELSTGKDIPLGPVAPMNGFSFSPSGRYLVTLAPNGEAFIRERPFGLQKPLGKLDWQFGVSFDPSERFLMNQLKNGEWKLRDLRSGNVSPLGELERVIMPTSVVRPFDFSPDGRFLTTWRFNGGAQVVSVHQIGIGETPLGERDGAGFSPDSRYLVLRAPNEGESLSLLELGTTTETALGSVGLVFDFSPDGRFALFGEGILKNLATGDEVPLGELDTENGYKFSPDGRFIVTRSQDGISALRKLPNTTAVPLGDLGSGMAFEFSPDSRFLVTQSANGDGLLRDLQSDLEAPLGRLTPGGSFTFSSSGRFLIYKTSEGEFTLRDLVSGKVTGLGALKEFLFSPKGGLLLTQFADGEWTLRDPASATPSLSAIELRDQTCASHPGTVRPFRFSVRSNSDPEHRGVFEILEGRPWNPCDWRGLAAGPEGWAQWLRWLQVVVLGLKDRDYKCGEVNAAGATADDRLAACRLAIPEDRWAAFIVGSSSRVK